MKELRFGDPNFQTWTLEEIKEALKQCSLQETSLDDTLGGGDMYTSESVVRSMVELIENSVIFVEG